MTAVSAQSRNAVNRALLARLTGDLGDSKTVTRICSDIGQLYGEFLPDVFHSETNLTVKVGYSGCEMGLMGDLIAGLGENVAISNVSLRNWSPHFVIACGNAFIITLMENLLGALPETIDTPAARPLSKIELDLAVMVLDKIGNVLRSGVNAPGGFEPFIERPRNASDRNRPAGEDDEFAVVIRMTIGIGAISSEFAIVVPQKALLKTVISFPKSSNQGGRGQKEWTEQITEQVHRSNVTLEARIRLDTLTLNTISRLMAGDVIPFQDKGDVKVDVSANGRDMYVCEFGRAGANYMVRVKDNISTDDELLQHLMS